MVLSTILAACGFPQIASADVGFLLPNAFKIDEGTTVTTIASFSDRFPSIEHPLRSKDFHILTVDGEKRAFDDIQSHDQVTLLTATLGKPGVYRLSSGNRLGRKGKASIVDGSYVRLGRDGLDPSELPAGSPILTSQTATISEVYIRHGEVELPTTLSTSGRLSLMLTAQDALGFTTDADLELSVLFDGKPLSDAKATLVASFDSYTDHGEGLTYTLTDKGQVTLSADRPGPHVIFVRHMAKAPAGAETDIRSYTTALVFELLP
ncbi:MAG: DUF4198 domain-containing protein [Pseudomonadota bacterium]